MKTIKKIVLVLSITMLHFVSNAAIIIVSNNPNVPGQYTSLQAAIDAAAPDDTLYVQGSTTSYGSVDLYKKLTLIGAGAMPNKSLSLPSLVDNIYIKYNANGTSNGSGSSISGFRMSSVTFQSYQNSNGVILTINNVTLSRNFVLYIYNGGNLSLYSTYSGITISNNYIRSISFNALGNGSVIKNNIIQDGISSTGGINSGNWLVLNNVIHYSMSSITNGVFINNIIYVNPTYLGGLKYCDFTKNIFYPPSTTQFVSDFLSSASQGHDHNTSSENIINQDPDFVRYTASDPISIYSISNPPNGPFIDYHLSNSSPGKNYGTDGTDIGIYGGTTPFVEGATTDSRFRYFPMPAMPQMLDLTITNQSIPANSTLNVNFSAEKKN